MAVVDGFLKAVLGPGADAVGRLRGDPRFSGYVVPRTASAWLASLPGGFAGDLPGTRVAVVLRKSDSGWGGRVQVGDGSYEFAAAAPEHAAAAILAALNVDTGTVFARDVDLARLGRTVDALVKAQAHRPNEGGIGPHAAPQGPQEQLPPVGAVPKQRPRLPRMPKATKAPSLEVTKSQGEGTCLVCGGHQLCAGAWTGCACLRGLRKASVEVVSGGYRLTLEGWTSDDVAALRAAVGV